MKQRPLFQKSESLKENGTSKQERKNQIKRDNSGEEGGILMYTPKINQKQVNNRKE
jgi:hypothetical protein